jgi:hypothetical protein
LGTGAMVAEALYSVVCPVIIVDQQLLQSCSKALKLSISGNQIHVV